MCTVTLSPFSLTAAHPSISRSCPVPLVWSRPDHRDIPLRGTMNYRPFSILSPTATDLGRSLSSPRVSPQMYPHHRGIFHCNVARLIIARPLFYRPPLLTRVDPVPAPVSLTGHVLSITVSSIVTWHVWLSPTLSIIAHCYSPG